jgi:hypothetical protein
MLEGAHFTHSIVHISLLASQQYVFHSALFSPIRLSGYPWELAGEISNLAVYQNVELFYGALGNVRLDDVYFGRTEKIPV